ncbi:MAG: O-methyltransferase [Candidatus Heimdallarchaeota archaeon]|nr:O-methyltransferase [Candidatus Heimdallarchaeota archaeon]
MISENILKILSELKDQREVEIKIEEAGEHIPMIKRSLAITPEEGQFLFNLVIATQAKTIIEIGTSFGYSTIWLGAAAKPNGGKVITYELIEEKARIARLNLRKAELEDYVEIITSNAFLEIPKLEKRIDIVFLDADKQDYINFIELLLPKLKIGGIILSDNILDCPHIHKENPEVCEDLVDYFQRLTNCSSVTIPFLPNGLEMTIKLSD